MDENTRKAVRYLLERARPVQETKPYTEFIIPALAMTILARVVNNGCTFDEARGI